MNKARSTSKGGPGEATPDARLAEEGQALARAIEEAVSSYVCEIVLERAGPANNDEAAKPLAQQAGNTVRCVLVAKLNELFEKDVDEQTTTPLSLLRSCMAPATEALRALHVEPPRRDPFKAARIPEDPYDLAPTKLAQLGDEVGERAISWGAAKAFAHRARHARS